MSYYYYYYYYLIIGDSYYYFYYYFPSLITGDSLRLDLVLVLNNTTVYLLELTVGFESNIKVNSDRKAAKYHPLLTNPLTEYTNINFVNFSMSALGIFGISSST